MAVMIGIDPHKGSHTAVAVADDEQVLGERRVRSAVGQVEQLMAWAAPFSERTWAIEGAGGLGYLLAQQLVAAGEHVLDVQPKLPLGSVCWPPRRRTRTIPTTPARLPSLRCAQRCRRFESRITSR